MVPKREDRFDLPAIDRPLAGRHFGSRDDLRDAVVEYIRADLTRRADPYHSADAAVFDALLTVYGVLAWAITAGRVAPADRLRFVDGEFHGFFSFLASGPPPRRLAEMLALHDAGLLQFAGPDLQISVRNGTFVGSSPAARRRNRRPRAGRRPVAPPRCPRGRERYSTSGAKSDAGDAHVLAEIVRLDRDHHRQIAGDTDLVDAVKLVARAHQTAIWERTRQVLRLRSTLREYFPAAFEAFEDFAAKDTLLLLARAPSPARAAKLTRSQVVSGGTASPRPGGSSSSPHTPATAQTLPIRYRYRLLAGIRVIRSIPLCS